MTDTDLLEASVRIPDQVVYREFTEEAVMLNLDSGTYHGLNDTAARMLDAASAAPTLGAAIETLADTFRVDRATLERDMVALCEQLAERGLLEVEPAASS